jgi:hypothetical protein
MSICGSFQFCRKGSAMLYPSRVTVHLHDTIQTKGLSPRDIPALMERVRRVIAEPVEENLRKHPSGHAGKTAVVSG